MKSGFWAAGLLGFLLLASAADGVLAAPWCGEATVTAYDRYGFSPRFADGTPVYAGGPVVAASTDIRTGSTVWVQGLGTFTARDRGDLGDGDPRPWIDVAMDTEWEARQWGKQVRRVCVS